MPDDAPTMPAPRTLPAEVARRSFSTVRRGFDPEEVRAFLEGLSRELQVAEQREQELLRELADAEERAQHPVIDEALLTSALGQRSAAVLRAAHEEAARIVQQAEGSAAALLRDAQHQATETEVRAESSAAERIAEAELTCNAVRQQGHDEASILVETARLEAEAIGARAREHGRAVLDQAQEARRRVLADMAQRRRAITDQIEQFRAARDEIAASVVGVRHSVDRIVDDLRRADDAARSAAAAAAQHGPRSADEHLLVEEAEQAASDIGVPTGAGDRDMALGIVEGSVRDPGGPTAGLRAEDVAVPVHPSPAGTAFVPAADLALGASVSGEVDLETDRPQVPGPDAGIPSGGNPGVTDRSPAEAGDGGGPAGGPDPVPGAAGWVAPAPAPEAGAGAGPGAAGQQAEGLSHGGGDGTGDVDVLFARLRAELPGDEAAGDEAPGGDAPGGDAPGGDAPGGDAPGDAMPEAGDGPVAPATSTAHGQAGATVEDEALGRRSEVLAPIVTNLARRLKRALQDDQNRLLERLRQGTGEWHDGVLADEESQRELYRRAAADGLRDAIGAGIAFARSRGPSSRGKAPAPDHKAVDALSEDLAASVVALLRRRLEGDDIADAAERVGAAYREWRGERIERMVEDRAVDAFGVGSLAGVRNGATLRWVTGSDGPGCADCEDNALAGDVRPGEQFPTGHRHPPAHAGCRCLVLPTPV